MANETKQGLLMSALVALLVSVATPWVIHYFNPNGPKTKIYEVNGSSQRNLDASIKLAASWHLNPHAGARQEVLDPDFFSSHGRRMLAIARGPGRP